MLLNREETLKLIKEQNLVENFINLEVQLTPNGFDLTVAGIFSFEGPGALDFSNKERELPVVSELSAEKKSPQDKFGWWQLKKGAYKIRTNEVVSMPNDLSAFATPRSSLLRMGAYTQTAVWDAGFKGASEFMLVVENPAGLRIKQNARIAQLVFMRINETDKGYDGIYQNK